MKHTTFQRCPECDSNSTWTETDDGVVLHHCPVHGIIGRQQITNGGDPAW